jgi:hypothetical protein
MTTLFIVAPCAQEPVGDLFAYDDVLKVMKALWEQVSRNQARVAEAAFAQ